MPVNTELPSGSDLEEPASEEDEGNLQALDDDRSPAEGETVVESPKVCLPSLPISPPAPVQLSLELESPRPQATLLLPEQIEPITDPAASEDERPPDESAQIEVESKLPQVAREITESSARAQENEHLSAGTPSHQADSAIGVPAEDSPMHGSADSTDRWSDEKTQDEPSLELQDEAVEPESHGPEIAEARAASIWTEPVDGDWGRRFLVLSDTANDISGALKTMRYAGLLGKKGGFSNAARGVTIVHTGDLIDKNRPSWDVLSQWNALAERAQRVGCRMRILAGNHEQETWMHLLRGETRIKGRRGRKRVGEFIEELDLIFVAGPVLFLHGFPTLEFLKLLKEFTANNGECLNCFNEIRYRQVFDSPRKLRDFAYVKKGVKKGFVLYNVKETVPYYKKNGPSMSQLFKELKIQVVIHGHRPQASGIQADYEFRSSLEGVRMIGNDVNVAECGLGGTALRIERSGKVRVSFINARRASKKRRASVRSMLTRKG